MKQGAGGAEIERKAGIEILYSIVRKKILWLLGVIRAVPRRDFFFMVHVHIYIFCSFLLSPSVSFSFCTPFEIYKSEPSIYIITVACRHHV